MALIKHTHAGRLVTRGFEDLGDLKQQAEEVVASARAEAQQIIERARVEAEALVKEAAPQGYAEGREKGMAAGRDEGRRQAHEEAIAQFKAEIEQLISGWNEALSRFEADRNDMLLAAREDILEFALAMGEKITHRIVDADPTVVTDQLVAALSLIAAPTAVTVSINPKDRRRVKSVLGRVVEEVSQCEHIELKDDPEVGRSGCIVATNRGHIDATVDQQIDRITKTLLSKKRPKKSDEATQGR